MENRNQVFNFDIIENQLDTNKKKKRGHQR